MRRVVEFLQHVLAAFFSRVMRSGFAQRFLSPHIAPLQQRLYRLTGGRFHVSALLVPTLLLVTTGAKSGQRRETPLMCFPEDGGTFLVAGSNWGQPTHPAWTANLLAHPDIEIVYRRERLPVRATLLTGADRDAVWPTLERQWPGYRRYETTAGRELRIFRLSPR